MKLTKNIINTNIKWTSNLETVHLMLMNRHLKVILHLVIMSVSLFKYVLRVNYNKGRVFNSGHTVGFKKQPMRAVSVLMRCDVKSYTR